MIAYKSPPPPSPSSHSPSSQWGENQQVGDKIRMLADPRAELARALGVEVDATAVLGNVRTKRYSAIIEDGKVVEFFLEPDGFGMSCSLAGNALTALAK